MDPQRRVRPPFAGDSTAGRDPDPTWAEGGGTARAFKEGLGQNRPMKPLFVDTSAWDAIADAGDPNHEMALLFKEEITGQRKLVVTNYILDELYNSRTG